LWIILEQAKVLDFSWNAAIMVTQTASNCLFKF
jgi:hypothetical protein